MARRQSVKPLAFWISFLTLLESSYCSQYTAYFTEIGTQLIVQDSSGNFTYSPCHSGSTPAWPSNSLILPVSVDPVLTGTNIAAVGVVQDAALYADLFYQNSHFDLEHARYKCDFDTGLYTLVSSEALIEALDSSDTVPTVSEYTGLAAVRLVELEETRVFFHDSDASLQQLSYSADKTAEIYTVEPRSDNNLEMAHGLGTSSPWQIVTMPRSLTNSDTTSTSTQNFTVNETEFVLATLESWPTKVTNLAYAIDQDSSKYIYYIGTDSALYNVSLVADVNFGAWSINPTVEDESYWPLADAADADFAVASDPGSYETRIYYVSGGSIQELRRTGKNTWAEEAVLPEKSSQNATLPSSSSSSSSTSSPSTSAPPSSASPGVSSSGSESDSSSSSGNKSSSSTSTTSLTTIAKIGIGIGCSIAGLLVLCGLLALFIRRKAAARSRQQQKQQQAQQDGNYSSNDDEAALAPYGLQTLHSDAKYSRSVPEQGAKGSLLDKKYDVCGGQGQVEGCPTGHDTMAASTVIYVPAYELPTSEAAPRYEIATTRGQDAVPQYINEAPSNMKLTELEGSASMRSAKHGGLNHGSETVHEK
ncbi:hypothetical protein BD289DRAFT_483567 [Coniella lustricola]|uniref:Fucose-specific lectin n=1 Tax=Coniella lustricola TaxID=2025994 RepID=A0A2T3A570_9PEZI|nr:hypothetical protein BD289DRAFT_483567 [Coniella lustricola]